MRTKIFLGVAFVIGLAGCEDKAVPGYERCKNLEAVSKGEGLQDAINACASAVAADPKSRAGRAAAKEKAELQQQLDAFRAAAAKALADAEQAAKDAQCHHWTTICTLGRFPDGSEQTTGIQHFGSKADCMGIGAKMGGIPCDPCRCRD